MRKALWKVASKWDTTYVAARTAAEAATKVTKHWCREYGRRRPTSDMAIESVERIHAEVLP
jgi:hypothetical protein